MNARLLMAPVLGIALAACVGCGDQPLAPALPTDPPAAPDHIVFAGVPLTLETYLSRDFMPSSPPNGLPMAASLTVRTTDGSPLPAGLTIASAGVYYQGTSWLSIPRQQTTNDPTMTKAVSREGPKWGPDVMVEVVVTLSLGGHKRALLGARDQLVHGTI